MSIFDKMQILVTDHAVYQFALRFQAEAPTTQHELPHLRRTIEAEVREAFIERRFSKSKPEGLHPPDDPLSLYAWDPSGRRVYAVRHDEEPPRFVVTTTMRPQ